MNSNYFSDFSVEKIESSRIEDEHHSEMLEKYDEKYRYEKSTNEMHRIKLDQTDKKIIDLLSMCPLVATNAIVDYVGDAAYKRIKVLFDNGYLTRFSVRDETDFVKSVFYLSFNCYGFLHIPLERFRAGVIDSLSTVEMLEVAAISRWVLYALKYQPKNDVELVRYREMNYERSFIEANMIKSVNAKWFRKGTTCNFHVICCPKDDKLLSFLEKLYFYENLVKEEEEKEPGSRSFVVIVCKSIVAMEHLAVEINNLIYTKTFDAIASEHFLYSLETDGVIELGAFKFMHNISLPDMTIRHEQVSFR